jgi:hypothetical protein
MIVRATQPVSSARSVKRPALHDRVRVPGGREGEVIGFYRRTNETVLVLFSSGKSDEFPEPDVELVASP